MSKTVRTPPSTPSALTESLSDPNIAAMSGTYEGKVNKNSRSKSPRCDDASPVNDFQNFKQDLKQEIEAMFSSWNSVQTKELSKMLQQQQTTILNKLMCEINEIKTQNSELKKSFLEVEKSVTFISSQYDEVSKKVSDMEKENKYLTEQVEMLKNINRDMQFSSRNSIIEIRNVPAKDNETYDDLVSIISKIGKLVDQSVTSADFRDVRRMPGKQGMPKPILAEFAKVDAKRNFISSIRKYNKKPKNKQDKLNTESIGIPGNRMPVYVSEFCLRKQKNSFSEHKSLQKSMDMPTVGLVYLRKKDGEKHIIIKSEQTLLDLQKTT